MNCVLDWIIECFFKGNTWPHQVLHRAGHALASSSSSWGHNLFARWMLWISVALWNHSASRSWPLLVCCYYSSSASAVVGRLGAPETATKTSGMTQTPHFLVFAFALSAGMACLAIFNIFSNAKLGTIWIAWIHGSLATACGLEYDPRQTATRKQSCGFERRSTPKCFANEIFEYVSLRNEKGRTVEQFNQSIGCGTVQPSHVHQVSFVLCFASWSYTYM